MTDRQKRKEAIKHANRQCPKCGAVHGQTVRTGNLSATPLQLAHPDHDLWNPDARTEVPYNGCHMSKDGPLHAADARRTRALQKNGNARHYRRNSVSNHELTGIARSLGVERVYKADEANENWRWRSEISNDSQKEMAYAHNQALYDLVATYKELAHTYAPQDEFRQDTMALCAAGGSMRPEEDEPTYTTRTIWEAIKRYVEQHPLAGTGGCHMITTPQSNADEQQERKRLSLAERNQRCTKEDVTATPRGLCLLQWYATLYVQAMSVIHHIAYTEGVYL